MLYKIHLGIAILGIALITACTPSKDASFSSLTPLPETISIIDPGDEILMESINTYITDKNGPSFTQFEFTRVDLDDDGRKEGLVMMRGPYQFWCGQDGCSMIVFKAHNNRFTPISEISPVRGPLTISENKSNGWKDIIVQITGHEYIRAHDVSLQFNGKNYPSHPAFQPKLYALNSVKGIRIFP